MKRIKILCAAAIASIALLFTSCLGDTDNSGTFSNLPGVARFSSGIIIVDTQWGPIHASEFDLSLYEGDCVLVSFNWNLDSDINNNYQNRGYVEVSLLSSPTAINKVSADRYLGDTTNPLTNEIAVTRGMSSAAYVNGCFFVTSHYEGMTKQTNSWKLSIDESQKPTVKDGINIYTFYLRAIREENGVSPSGEFVDINAFDIKYIIDAINDNEKTSNSSQYFGINLKYASKIEKDMMVEWSTTDNYYFVIDRSDY